MQRHLWCTFTPPPPPFHTLIIMFQVEPKSHVLQKYSQAARGRFLSIPDTRKFGRQVLEALNFLLEKGFVLGKRQSVVSFKEGGSSALCNYELHEMVLCLSAGHVHAGNVMVEEGVCK